MCGDNPKHAAEPASRLESRDRWPWLATCFAAGTTAVGNQVVKLTT
jgi:hypothetical protein